MLKTDLKWFKPTHIVLKKSICTKELLDAVVDGRFHGFICCSLEVPQKLFSLIDMLGISYLFKKESVAGKSRLIMAEKVENAIFFR